MLVDQLVKALACLQPPGGVGRQSMDVLWYCASRMLLLTQSFKAEEIAQNKGKALYSVFPWTTHKAMSQLRLIAQLQQTTFQTCRPGELALCFVKHCPILY